MSFSESRGPARFKAIFVTVRKGRGSKQFCSIGFSQVCMNLFELNFPRSLILCPEYSISNFSPIRSFLTEIRKIDNSKNISGNKLLWPLQLYSVVLIIALLHTKREIKVKNARKRLGKRMCCEVDSNPDPCRAFIKIDWKRTGPPDSKSDIHHRNRHPLEYLKQ